MCIVYFLIVFTTNDNAQTEVWELASSLHERTNRHGGRFQNLRKDIISTCSMSGSKIWTTLRWREENEGCTTNHQRYWWMTPMTTTTTPAGMSTRSTLVD
nr:unnamed protein product [Callosobruchus analis]